MILDPPVLNLIVRNNSVLLWLSRQLFLRSGRSDAGGGQRQKIGLGSGMCIPSILSRVSKGR